MSPQDAYARARRRRALRAVAANGGEATQDELEVLRECFAYLNRDTPRVCAGRQAPYAGRRRYPRTN